MDEKSVEEGLSMIVDGRRQQAQGLIDDFWAWKMEEDGKHDVKEKSRLGVRIPKRKANEGVYIEWYEIVWKRKGREWYQEYKGIPKGRTDRYPGSRLGKKARDWEVERVQELEDELARIRKSLRALGKAKRYLRDGLNI